MLKDDSVMDVLWIQSSHLQNRTITGFQPINVDAVNAHQLVQWCKMFNGLARSGNPDCIMDGVGDWEIFPPSLDTHPQSPQSLPFCHGQCHNYIHLFAFVLNFGYMYIPHPFKFQDVNFGHVTLSLGVRGGFVFPFSSKACLYACIRSR